MFSGRPIEVEVECEGADASVHVDAAVLDTKRLVQDAGWLLLRIRRPKKLRRRFRASKRGAQGLQKIRLRAPEVLRAQLHHLAYAVKRSLKFELAIELNYRRP